MEKEDGMKEEPQVTEVRPAALAPAQTGMGLEISPEQLSAAIVVQEKNRALITEFIRKQLIEGTDYGKIHIKSSCVHKYDPERCTDQSHWSKKMLFKPGMEKIFSLLMLSSRLERDLETMEMLGGMKNLVAYVCVIYRNGVAIGEGRGAAEVGERGRDANSAIKIAEKRARMDACLSLGFSEFFTSEDIEGEAAAREESARLESQRTRIWELMKQRGITTAGAIRGFFIANGVRDRAKMTSQQADMLITRLAENNYNMPAQDIAVVTKPTPSDEEDYAGDDTDVPGFTPEPPYTPDEDDVPPTGEFEASEELMQSVRDDYETIGFNARGGLWFQQDVTGKSYYKFDDYRPADWARARGVLTSILEQRVELDPRYVQTQVSAKLK
jgi:hypothetical protein